MRLLHTADWHVGKAIRGKSRADEHRAVLREIIDIARARRVDAAIVAGDLFDSATPSAESEAIVYEALLGLAEAAAHVVVVAGNHDHPGRLAAVRPVLTRLRVHVAAQVVRPDDGGVIDLPIRPGERLRVVLLPFVSQRGIVRAADLMKSDADEQQQKYAVRLAEVIARLCAAATGDGSAGAAASGGADGGAGGAIAGHEGPGTTSDPESNDASSRGDAGGATPRDRTAASGSAADGHRAAGPAAGPPRDAVTVLVGHAMVHGGTIGGGERSAHTVFEYSIPTTAFPASLHYVALGHLHRAQTLPAACPVRYCGPPLHLDFGEAPGARSVTIVDAHPGRPAAMEEVPLRAGRALAVLRGSLHDIAARVADHADAWIRVDLDDAPRHGLADEARALSPNVVDVRIAPRAAPDATAKPLPRPDTDPIQLFDDFLAERNESDPEPVRSLFRTLLDEDDEAEAPRA